MGTDGIDGRSDAAGGFVTPKTVSILREKETQMKKYSITMPATLR